MNINPVPEGPMQNASAGVQYATPQAPEYGVTSAMKELIGEINCVREVALQIRSTLGISQPSQNAGQTTGPQSFVEVLRTAIYTLRETNSDLTDCLRHLNT